MSWQNLDLDFTEVVFDGGDFENARFSGGNVSFDGAKFSGGTVSFERAVSSGDLVSFDGAVFPGGRVSFGSAVFSGGTVRFVEPFTWSCPPAFDFTGTPPPDFELPAGYAA